MATLRDRILNPVRPSVSGQQLVAEEAGEFRRGLRGAVQGFQANAALADEAAYRADGNVVDADAQRMASDNLRAQQGMAPRRVGRVEDIDGVGDAVDWAAGAAGSGIGSMAAPIAAGSVTSGAGALLQLAPSPGLRAVGRGLQRFGTPAVALGIGAEQQKGEFYGEASADPAIMNRFNAEEINDTSNAVGLVGGALDAILPTAVARGITGAGLRRGLSNVGPGARTLGGAAVEGLTETGQGEIGRQVRGVMNPEQDTNGFGSDRLNEFAEGVVGGAGPSAVGAFADAGYRRVGDTAARGGEALGESMGQVIDMGGEAVEKATGLFKRGKEKVIDLKPNELVDQLKEATKGVASKWQTNEEEVNLMRGEAPEEIMGDDNAYRAWYSENNERRSQLINDRLKELADAGDQQAVQYFEGMNNPDTLEDTIDEAGLYVADQSRLDDTARAAERLGAAAGGAARAMGRMATSIGGAFWDGATRKQNKQTNDRSGLLGDYMASMTQPELQRYGRVKGDKSIPKYMRQLGNDLSAMINAGAAGDPRALLHVNRMANHMVGAYGARAAVVADEMAGMVDPSGKPLMDLLGEQIEKAQSTATARENATVRRAAADAVLTALPKEVEAKLMKEGINLRTDEGKRQILGMTEAVAMGRATPDARKALESLVGEDAMIEMVRAITPGAKDAEAEAEANLFGGTEEEDADDSSVDSDFDKAQGDKKLERQGGAKYYAFGRRPTIDNSKTRRDPFASIDTMSREDRLSREAQGEVVPNRRPQLMRKDQTLSDGTSAIDGKIAQMERHLGTTEGKNYEVAARSAAEVLDSIGAQPAKRVQLFIDYMEQEGKELGNDQGARMRDLGKVARRVLQDMSSGARAGAGAVAGTQDANQRSSAGERVRVQRAVEKFFNERFLVVGEQKSDVDPERITRADFDNMVKNGKTVMAQREAKADFNSHAHRNNILFFEDDKGNSMPIKADDVSRFSLSARRVNEEAGSNTRQWVNDLMSGIAALMESGYATALPTRLDAAGNVESFADGIPMNLMLPSGKLYGEAVSARRRNPKSITPAADDAVEVEQADDQPFVPDDTKLPERSDQDEVEGLRTRTRAQGMDAANLPRGAKANTPSKRELNAASDKALEVATTPGKPRAARDGVHESRVRTIAENALKISADFKTVEQAAGVVIQALARAGVPREQVLDHVALKSTMDTLRRRRQLGDDVDLLMAAIIARADQTYSFAAIPKLNDKIAGRLRAGGKVSEFMADIIANPDVPTAYKVIAGAVTKVAGSVPVRELESMANAGEFNSVRGDIFARSNATIPVAGVILHEAVHAATVRALNQDADLQRAVYNLMAHVVGQDKGLSAAYGLANTYEFLAEGMTNRGLQERLMKIKPSGAVARYLGSTMGNAWEAFVGLVRKALGVPEDHDSALMQLLDLGARSMRATAKAGVTSTREEVSDAILRPVVPGRVVDARLAEIEAMPQLTPEGKAAMAQYRKDMMANRDKDAPSMSHNEATTVELLAESVKGQKVGVVDADGLKTLILNASVYADRHAVFPTGQLNAQDAREDNAGAPSTMGERKDAIEYVKRVLGPEVKVQFQKMTGFSGEWIDAENTVLISTTAAAGAQQTAYHEALHAFFSKFVKGDQRAFEVLKELAENKNVLDRVHALLAGYPAAQAQLKDGEERLAYMYQFWADGKLDLPYGAPRTLFQKIGKFFRRVLGMVNDTERATAMFEAFHAGEFAGSPKAADKAKQKALQQGMWGRKQLRKMDALTQRAAAFVLPAESILRNSASVKAQEIGRAFFANPGEESAGKGETGYLNARDQMTRRYTNEFSHIVSGMTSRDYTDVANLMNSGADLADIAYAPHRKAVKELRALLKRFREYMVDERGVKMGDQGEKYFPRVWSMDKLMNSQDAFFKMMEDNYPDQNAEAVFNALTQNLVDDLEYGRPTSEEGVLTPLNRSGEQRVFSWMAAADAAPFLENNLVGVLTRYFHEGVRAAEYTHRFGQDGKALEVMLDSARKELKAESQAMIRRGELKDELAAAKWTERQYRDVRESVGAMEGTLGKDISATWRKTNSWVVVYQNIRLLPMSLFASVVDPLGVVARGGEFREAYDAFLRGMGEVGKQWGDLFRSEPRERVADRWERLAEYVGAVDAAIFETQVSDMYSSVYMTPQAKALNQSFFKLNGMEAWNRGMRVGAAKAAVQFIQRHSKLPEVHSQRWLDELGLKPDDIIVDPDGNLMVTVGEIAAANGMDRKDAREIAGRVHNAINRWVTGAVLTPNAAQRPAWGSDPHYSMFFHLRQFTYSFHQTILKRAANELNHGNIAPLGALFWYIPVMIASDITKGLIQGGGELPTHMKGMDAAEWVMHGAERAGLIGLGQLGVDAGADLGSIGGPAVEQVLDAFSDPLERTAVSGLPANALYREAFR